MTSAVFSLPRLEAAFLGAEAIAAVFAAPATLRRMAAFEAALARAQASVGLVPAAKAGVITAVADEIELDPLVIAAGVAAQANAAMPFVKAFTAAVATRDPEAAGAVHLGATSQDVVDTAFVLGLRVAAPLIESEAQRAVRAFARAAQMHRTTMMAGRTLMMHAVPIPLGLKLAQWAALLARETRRFAAAAGEAQVLQFGGAAGTLAALGDDGFAVSQALALELGLTLPATPWHTQRDRLLALAAAAAGLTAAAAKIARDCVEMMQTDIAEVAESALEGGGQSSTMPHKRNPVLATRILAAAVRAPGLLASLHMAAVQEHERGVGGWQAEAGLLPDLLITTGADVEALAVLAEGLTFDAERMAQNLAATKGALMAEAVQMRLAGKLGKAEAHRLMSALVAKAAGRPLEEVVAADPAVSAVLTRAEIANAFDPLAYRGASDIFIDRALAEAEA